MIDISDVCFAYRRGSPVLRQLHLSIQQGEMCFIVGASGSGKSTLLRILAGLLPSERNLVEHEFTGSVKIAGSTPIAFRRGARTGFVFQDYALLPFLSVYDNVALPLRYGSNARSGQGDPHNAVFAVLETVGLAEKAAVFPHALSGGMRARLALARALVGNPKLLLIDEAFAALDIGWRASLYSLLSDLRKNLQLTIVVVSHDLVEASDLADRVVVLSAAGRVAADMNVSRHGRAPGRLITDIQEVIMRDHPSRFEPGDPKP